MVIGFVTALNAQAVSPPTFIVSGNPISANEMTTYLNTLVTAINNLQTTVAALQSTDTANMPVGTIIASFIAPDASHDYMNGSTVWALADNSNPYVSYTGPFPDMSGRFLRGMDVNADVDPDTRAVGSLQSDAIKFHRHSLLITSGVGNAFPTGLAVAFRGGVGGSTAISTEWEDYTGDGSLFVAETRPTNVAVYWYIKVK